VHLFVAGSIEAGKVEAVAAGLGDGAQGPNLGA
jgi:hypothetical protein